MRAEMGELRRMADKIRETLGYPFDGAPKKLCGCVFCHAKAGQLGAPALDDDRLAAAIETTSRRMVGADRGDHEQSRASGFEGGAK
jgi:hypothetical protein